MRQIYFDGFSDYEQMLKEWGNIPSSALVPKSGADVLFAAYGLECYSGDALVVFRYGSKLYEVNGGHCSCYGLESQDYYGDGDSQWSPEETSREALAKRCLDWNLDSENDAKAKESYALMLQGLENPQCPST